MRVSRAHTLRARLGSSRGESLIEVLVAIVVSGLAILMLATVIASATTINKTSREAMNGYYDKSNAIAETSDSNGSGTVTLGSGGDEIPLDKSNVRYYIEEQDDGTPVVKYGAVSSGDGD